MRYQCFPIAAWLCAVPLGRVASQTFVGRAVEDSTSRALVQLQVVLWKFTRDSVYVVDSMRTDSLGRFEVVGDGTGRYQLRFGKRDIPAAIGPMDSVPLNGVLARLYRVPLMRIGDADPFVLEQVDLPALSIEFDPDAHYPRDLRRQCIDGDVLPSVVVDADGHPDMSTFQIVGTSNPAFNDAVRDAVARARFQPAEIGGFTVRQLVSSPVHFRSFCRR